ncbi:MAG: hypothetical protein A2163_00855 [Actinobacteria bacterium RBG_13_35_12]|nr:MAG: hypothetical protein A2163_00855 [Actinobacteria bacterium RBG_13_35_12]
MYIELLTTKREAEYTEFLQDKDEALFNSSLMFRDLLIKTTGAEPCYFLAINCGKIVGVLPVFIKHGKYGAVLNSMPWYGSNPGIIVKYTYISPIQEIETFLLNAFHQFAKDQKVISSTIISRPFENVGVYLDGFCYDTIDSRIGMVTDISSGDIINSFHPKTRNLIRKAQKEKVKVYESLSLDDLLFVADLHKLNMEKIGGIPKPQKLFLDLNSVARIGKDFKVWIAEEHGQKIAGLVLKYFNKTVDYMTPAINVEFRSFQPLNLLIFEAMQDAAMLGYKSWNWGGTTLPEQQGVFHYKERFGAKKCNYFYLTKVYDDSIYQLDKKTILSEYPYFYVCPFNNLKEE